MEKHRTVLGALFLALGVMGLIGMASVLLVFLIGSAAITAAAANEPDVPALVSLLPAAFGLFISTMIALCTIPSLIAAYGLLLGRSWGRIWALIAGVLNIPNLPFGTGVGIYALWVFLQEEDRRMGR